MRCLNDDVADDEDRSFGVTVHYGDGVTVYAAGTPEAAQGRVRGAGSDDDGDGDAYGGRMMGDYDEYEEDSDDY